MRMMTSQTKDDKPLENMKEAKNGDGLLMESIQAQTQLLQNMRHELEAQQRQRNGAKSSLRQRIQRLTNTTESSLTRSRASSTTSLRDSFERALLACDEADAQKHGK